MNRRSSFASLMALVVALFAAVLPAQNASAQDRPGSIAGLVTADRAVVENAVVVLSNAGGPVARTSTDANGHFEFARVPAGRYHLVATKDGFGSGEAGAAVLAGQATRVHINMVDNRPGALAGGVFNADGPVADATVVIRNRAGEVARTTSGPDGRFGFRSLPAGAYSVSASKDGVGRGAASVTIRPGTVSTVRIELRAMQDVVGGIAGVVSNADGPVADAVVVLRNARGEIARTTTNADGVYGFRGLRPGVYGLTASKRGVGEGSTRAEVTAGNVTRAPITLVAPPQGGTLNGHVGHNGAIVAGAQVTASLNGRPVASMLSGRDGSFSFAHLRPGHYVVTAALRGVGQGTTEADVTEGGTTTIRVIIP